MTTQGARGFVENGSGRYCGGLQHLLGEGLRPLDARGRLARPEHGHAGAPKLVRDARDERRLGADDDEVDLVLAAEAEEALDVVHADRVAAAECRDPGIPRRRMQLRQPLALRDLPRERVLAAARPQDQHLHVGEFKAAGGCFKYRRRAVGGPVWSNLDLTATSGRSEWQQLEPLVVDSPVEALGDLDDLIRRMLVEAGYPVDTPDPVDDEGVDPEVLGSFRAAHEVRLIVDRGEDFDPGDVGHAIGLYREIYEHVLTAKSISASPSRATFWWREAVARFSIRAPAPDQEEVRGNNGPRALRRSRRA